MLSTQSAPTTQNNAFESIVQNNKGLRANAVSTFADQRRARDEKYKGDAQSIAPVFLRPQDINKSIEYGVDRVFTTTLGGIKRFVTRDDLIAFKQNIAVIGDRFKKGITAKQIISLSLPVDVERANEQINLTLPHSHKGGVFHFITNASKDSKDTHHHVHVQFASFKRLASNESKIPLLTTKEKLNHGRLRFECDCGRHNYWYRYMATIGGYGYGRKELGYPKEKNPELAGVACKHIIAVMGYLLSGAGYAYMHGAVTKAQKKNANTRITTDTKTLNQHLNDQKTNPTPSAVGIQAIKTREVKIRVKRLTNHYQAQVVNQIENKMRHVSSTKAKAIADWIALRRLKKLKELGVISGTEYSKMTKK
ncbi:hypothetical protein F965_00486 [Acinetobacter schindleri NIPH 900]|uniref:SWIM-type domain-containing protein n=1 Tax=Acinetobacter schindleri NIPH 900 TaxID=1217675 RepID=N8Y3M4_9GAMM|nr:hypothetical protein [Acinetobacter schindleri]ENV14243.1 hypothetical protein F965_00486 [Acinetobacter schindleri NIPH 900]